MANFLPNGPAQQYVQPGYNAVSIAAAATTNDECRGVWIGTTQSVDLYVNGAWVTFQGATAGTIIPVRATGARKTAAAAAPTAGDIVFLY